jgi:hypothetical protein
MKVEIGADWQKGPVGTALGGMAEWLPLGNPLLTLVLTLILLIYVRILRLKNIYVTLIKKVCSVSNQWCIELKRSCTESKHVCTSDRGRIG